MSKQQLEQIVLQTEDIRKFVHGDLLIAATIEDELEFVVKNYPELFLDKIEKNHRSRGATLSCIGEKGVITQFHSEKIDGFAEDSLAFEIRDTIKNFNPENDCVIVHVGRDAQACVGIFSIASLRDYRSQRLIQFGEQDLIIYTTD
ncbi:hypothetical protein [Pseudanabaena sp. 'Roaring Creek']|uniref:hypothetical protein n=1 Tax=Pseudanabaena sp. 'Roaring Creek' TaxID=1681830 RepID=UPI0006D8006B|nr:hypothetical protein [Pseudanabaena sp. 'Roaring Creek']